MSLSDDEQFDQFKSFAKKYGSAIISGILIALIAFFGWEYWQKKTLAEAQSQTAKVQKLMDEAKVISDQPNAFATISESADKIVKEDANSVHAIQTQFLLAKLAYDKDDYAAAEKALKKVENTTVKDAGLVQIVKLRLADAQLAQKKYDEALKTLANVTEPTFKATVDELRGDIFVAKKDTESARKAYQSAWDSLIERKKERQLLQIKLESVGVLVDDPEIERPILDTNVDES
ncbi:tetratricopeptide repeat protein [Acinetobacter halotolerans]|uniref:Ancillary SecYEG translocon subunit n=1 Tax=Acinetobacter halotolerans TaxID=1752076 RepID=A0A4Q6XG57_9GAMM|nr:tetratricopeptide repeat protein [Acinetobacter halotolerans]RZF50766.1 tetratricopeptide repeat protein [Acinetobacter halotolerans]